VPLNIKNAAVEALVDEVVAITGETRTEAVRRALEDRRANLAIRRAGEDRHARLLRFLAAEVDPLVPAAERGRRLTRDEEAALLGYGPDGV
jgi:antitoxin VapB